MKTVSTKIGIVNGKARLCLSKSLCLDRGDEVFTLTSPGADRKFGHIEAMKSRYIDIA